ncbi:MAG TPA: SRPBCC family protein, partial [Holophaga sp.]|nr:SRPBCC family protein [Holophaga sp.]
MWGTEHTVETTAAPEAVWARWQAMETWPEWDEDLTAASLDGPWQAGSRITLTRIGGRRELFTVET